MACRCFQCGKAVPVYAAEYNFSDGTKWARKGMRHGSSDMRTIDPNNFFCTMRCAARYGVIAAKRGGPNT